MLGPIKTDLHQVHERAGADLAVILAAVSVERGGRARRARCPRCAANSIECLRGYGVDVNGRLVD